MTDIRNLDLRAPTVTDGPALWRMAADSKALDVNSLYAYLLWCRDFADTSVIAQLDQRPAGFVTGYLRPDEPTTLLMWQVAVQTAHRAAGIAGLMLDHLTQRLLSAGITHVEASTTPDNIASQRLFGAFARRWHAPVERRELFGAELFPDGHAPEQLLRIGPLRADLRRATHSQ